MKYVFLDLDGTISDSSEGITNCIAEALETMGVRVEDKNTLKKYIGPPLSVSFRDYFEGEDIERAIGLYRARYRESGWKENRMYPGIPEALAALRKGGKQIVMATSKPEEFARRIAEYFGIASYFTAICGASLDQRINTKAEVIAYAMKTLGLSDPKEIVMVGDRYHDVEGAAEFGIAALGVTYGFGTAEELLQAGAFAVADSPEEMSRSLLAM
ncbi:MAG: HAD hydrolase-like protein [Lachnospiraceae bacterium]|nr:HAD hydrolase-like protein [Lachnospiraceae bacterium]